MLVVLFLTTFRFNISFLNSVTLYFVFVFCSPVLLVDRVLSPCNADSFSCNIFTFFWSFAEMSSKESLYSWRLSLSVCVQFCTVASVSVVASSVTESAWEVSEARDKNSVTRDINDPQDKVVEDLLLEELMTSLILVLTSSTELAMEVKVEILLCNSAAVRDSVVRLVTILNGWDVESFLMVDGVGDTKKINNCTENVWMKIVNKSSSLYKTPPKKLKRRIIFQVSI